MSPLPKIFFTLFLFHLLFFSTLISFAQTDTLPVTDTIPAPAVDTTINNEPETEFSDTLAAPSTDTANVLNSPTDTSIIPIQDTATAAIPADTIPKPLPPKKIIAQFDTFPLLLKPGEIISKTLQVINGTESEFTFSLSITFPGGWKALTNTERIYTISPLDTYFIPIRIVPQGKVQGNTKYLIYAYVKNEKNTPVASAHFLAAKQKIIKWDINVSPDEKIYLLNDDNSADFSINIFNTGNEEIGLMLDMSNFRKDRIALMDTNERILKKPVYTFDLLQEEDTTFYFKARYTDALRNYRLIDTENYRPGDKGEAQKYSIFAQSRESVLQGKGSLAKGKKIDLIRLSDETKVNPYGKPSLPLVMDVNISNILGAQPVMNMLFRGMTYLNNGAFLSYSAATYFSTYFLNSRFLAQSFFNIGYFDKKFNVQIGNVGGAGGGGGRGISGNYYISRNHSVGGFFTRGPRFIDANTTSFGVNHNFAYRKFMVQSNYYRVLYSINKYNIDYFLTNVSYSLAPKHSIGVGGMVTRTESYDPLNSFIKFGYMVRANYSGSFFKDRLQSGISGSYSSPNIGFASPGTSWTANHSSTIKASNNLRLQLTNLYQHRDSSQFQPLQTIFNNSLVFLQKTRKLNISPTLFYNVMHFDTLRFHSRGVGINYSNFDYETNRMIGFNVRGGYNKILNLPELQDYFFLQTFLVFRYRVFSGNIRYTYGTFSATDLSFMDGVYPQSVGVSLNYQHQFRNPHFVLNNNFTYNHVNRLKRHSFGYTPQLFYFTNSGWRFYVSPGYYFSVSKSSINANRFPGTSQEITDPKPLTSQNVVINAGIRKEFGIPIPWMKTRFPTLRFLAFIDHDGNNKQSPGEVSLENVVVKLGDWETLTDERGFVTFRNVYGDSTYPLGVFSLVDLNGYFPNVPSNITAVKDSLMYIPFVKGVKIHGNVYLDREKITPGVEKPLDLSGIRITATNGKAINTLTDGKGDFSFYVPFGKYIITMDEKVLGDRFTILQNNIELELDQKTESIFLTFYIVEKRRKITVKKFNGNGERIKDSDTTITPKTKTIEELKKEEEDKKRGGLSPQTPNNGAKDNNSPANGKPGRTGKGDKVSTEDNNIRGTASNEPLDKSQIKFKVQIGAYGSNVPNEVVDKIKSLPDVKESKTEEGLTRYTAGEFSDYESAQALRQELINRGISSDTTFVIIIADYKGRVFSADEAKELLKY